MGMFYAVICLAVVTAVTGVLMIFVSRPFLLKVFLISLFLTVSARITYAQISDTNISIVYLAVAGMLAGLILTFIPARISSI